MLHLPFFLWLYLEPILSNDDGDLGSKFRKVDQGFRQVTRILESDPRLSAVLQSSRLQSMLDSISDQLATCQSALNIYIDDKRSVFPRLYFLSDDDLLELLGQARAGADGRVVVMQTHLKKLFPGITGVRLGPGDLSITALCSVYGETFQLDHPVDIDSPVEVWLKNLETEMRSSLRNMTLKCVSSNSLKDHSDPFSLPTQILCLAQNIRFTEKAEKAIISKELHKLKEMLEKENSYYASVEIEDDSERCKRQALILQCAHYLSVIKTLIDNNVVSPSDWMWQKQLRFYMLKNQEVVAKMGLAQISYSYEYLGVNTGQFVRTESADDCFYILTQSLHLGFMGNPFGPAGTGKTESVKALGSLFGRLVLIFNCDEAIDAECMGRLLSGLALCGAWGCFDEFNRLSAQTLAAVTHQLSSLLAALTDQKPGTEPKATLNGKQVMVSPWCGVAATMNPSGRGYGGRRALPAAAQRCLLPVCQAAPPARVLAARLLAAQAALHHEQLAADLHDVFELAKSLLSSQRHYDWGLRALKAAVGSSAALLQRRGPELAACRAAVRRVLTLNNYSKLTAHDARKFNKILSLIFADVPTEEFNSDPINSALESAVDTLKLVHNKLQIQKCLEVYEQLQQRMGVMIVGPPGSGKTTIRQILKTALAQQGKSVVEYVICPKAMSREWLLGSIEPDTRQWTDGAISATALEVSSQPADVWSWVVCDGDVDPEWIEALNSVLDDNRLLTLPSGWRIQFGSNVNFLFETHSVEHASPATVSRMGIILLSDEVSCYLDYLAGWVKRVDFDNETPRLAVPLLNQVIHKCIQWINEHKSDLSFKVYNIALVKQILTQFEYLAQDTGLNAARHTPEDLVHLSIERSVVDVLKDSAVDNFRSELLSLTGAAGISIKSEPLVGQWVTESLLMSRRLAACEATLRACMASDTAHLLIVGPDACAKNILAEYIVKECNSTIITIDCTPILEPADIIAELKRHKVSGAGSRATLVLRALHRARADSWGTRPLDCFLLQVMQQGAWWSGDGWCVTSRVRVLCTATKMNIAPRLAAALHLVTLTDPDDEELTEIATNNLRNSTDKTILTKDIFSLVDKTLGLYKEVNETFYNRSHYKWNASHLRRLCENVKWYSPANVEQLQMAIVAEAKFIFRERLVSVEEKATYDVLCMKYLKMNTDDLYFECKVKADGVYLQRTDYMNWYQTTKKLINQCLSENGYNVFGELGAEVCSEMSVLCPAIARAANGGLSVLVGASGVSRRAAAWLTAAALPAALVLVHDTPHFNNLLRNAVSSASEGARTLAVVCGAGHGALPALEALRRATTAHALAHLMHNASAAAVSNIKQNLGIVICLDKDQEDLAELMGNYPLLYHEGTIVWIERWSDVTLRDMPRLIVERMLKETAVDDIEKQLDSLPIDGFVNIHKSIDVEWKNAPCRYVNFVKSYYNLSSRKRSALVERQTMLSSGVEALRRARSDVARLQAEAAEQEVALREAQTQASNALQQISATVRANTDQKDEMQILKRNIEIENEKLQVQKKEIEAELAAVEPIITAARSAVGDIRPESLSEVRSLRAPPEVVRDVLEGVLRLMGIADTSWHSMKNFLSKRGVKEDIRCLDASQISPAALVSVQRLLETRGASFEAAAARRASAACAPLAAWVRANLHYAAALQRVQPLQNHQALLHKNLSEAEQQMMSLSSGLATVEQRVSALQQQLAQHSREAATLELRVTQAHDTIAAATALLDQLATEYTAWETHLEYISTEISQLSQRALLSAAYIVYLPDVTEPQAREHVSKWSSLIGFEDTTFSIINFLSSPEKQLKWEADGLPSDTSAIKNAVIIDQYLESQKCGFTPLIIDPDGEGLAWLKHTLADLQCDFVSERSEKFMTTLQYAGRLGRTVVITDVEDVERATLASAGARVVLQARRAPTAATHVRAALAPLHFAPTLHALADQLVHYALQQQNPDMKEKSKEVKLKKATLQKQQHELQENLLRELSTKSDILQDVGVLASLNKTRESNERIRSALADARDVEQAIREASSRYGASALHAASLALSVNALAGRWPLVQVPSDIVLDVFVDALRRQSDQKNINNEEVKKYLTRKIIERVLLGVHKQDKYIVVMHLLQQVYEDIMPDKLWQIFLGNNDLLEDTDSDIKNKYSWIPQDCVKKVVKIKAVDEDLFNRLTLDDEGFWKEFLKSGNINLVKKLKLSSFETVVVVSVMLPNNVYQAITAFVDQILGAGLQSQSARVSAAQVCSARRRRAPRPVLLLAAHAPLALVAQAPPATLLQVGIGEGRSAWESALESCRNSGWLAIVVAASPFSQDLLAFVSAYVESPGDQYHEDFRLWILSEDRDIPPQLSNACVNVILESPEGVKNNVMNTLSSWGSYEAEAKTVRLHIALAMFHALVQERRAYIPQGWTQWYSWEWGEVEASARALRAEGAGGAGGAARACGPLYGARVSAGADGRSLAALAQRYLSDEPLARAWRPAALDMPLPYSNTIQDYVAALEGLPNTDTPDLLALPANCRIAWEKNTANNIVNKLKELNSTVVTTNKKDGVMPLKSLLSLWKKLMSGSPFLKGDFQIEKKDVRVTSYRKERYRQGSGGWWRCACEGEARDAARAARALHAALCAALAHRPALPSACESWQEAWSGPSAPDAYVRELGMRARAALLRLQDPAADDPDYIPAELDMRKLMSCARALSAMRALAAARLRRAPHALALRAHWDTDTDTDGGSREGVAVVVVGLRLSGATVRGGALHPAHAHDAPHAPAPPLLLRYVPQEACVSERSVCVPLYSDEQRSQLLLEVHAPLAHNYRADLAALHAPALFLDTHH